MTQAHVFEVCRLSLEAQEAATLITPLRKNMTKKYRVAVNRRRHR